MENSLTSNDKVLALIRERLELGQKRYGGDIPVRGEGGRDNLKESIEEAIDLSTYLSATLIELKEKRDIPKVSSTGFKAEPETVRLLLSGLHTLYTKQYEENQLDYCTKIDTLIQNIKTHVKWTDEEEAKLLK
tara:strand:- start:2563 stop:2961 length:399 start_codon:yes stop_codon:yes gene_type:complete